MPELTVYTRRGCHLCEVLIEELMPLVRGRAHIHLRDVDGDSELAERYGLRVPVLEGDGEVLCECHLDRVRVAAFLRENGDGTPEKPRHPASS